MQERKRIQLEGPLLDSLIFTKFSLIGLTKAQCYKTFLWEFNPFTNNWGQIYESFWRF